jgi:hypothetical protein
VESIAVQQIARISGKLKEKPRYTLVSEEEYKRRIDICIDCPDAIDSIPLCLECGCNFIKTARFKEWHCKQGKF